MTEECSSATYGMLTGFLRNPNTIMHLPELEALP